MRMRRAAHLSVFAALALTACSEEPSAPSTKSTPSLAVTSAADPSTGRHIVAFAGNVPNNFTANVQALGGQVLWVSPETGLAAVSGLQGSAATALASQQGIMAVDADEMVVLDDIPQVTSVDGGISV